MLLVAGCASMGVQNPNGEAPRSVDPSKPSEVSGIGIESAEIIRVSAAMVRDILNTPKVKNAERPMNVVLMSVENDAPITFSKDIFLLKMRAELIKKQPSEKLKFLDRAMLDKLKQERELKRTGEFTSSSDPNVQEFKGADLFLTGKLSGISTATEKGNKNYVLFTFRLTDARTTEVIWEGSEEMAKEGQHDSVHR
jgi:hypothetical protein